MAFRRSTVRSRSAPPTSEQFLFRRTAIRHAGGTSLQDRRLSLVGPAAGRSLADLRLCSRAIGWPSGLASLGVLSQLASSVNTGDDPQTSAAHGGDDRFTILTVGKAVPCRSLEVNKPSHVHQLSAAPQLWAGFRPVIGLASGRSASRPRFDRPARAASRRTGLRAGGFQ